MIGERPLGQHRLLSYRSGPPEAPPIELSDVRLLAKADTNYEATERGRAKTRAESYNSDTYGKLT